jgi:hypothetical protein
LEKKPLQTPTEDSVLEDSVPEDRGDPSGEWAIATGVFQRALDMEHVETLSKGLSLADEADSPPSAPVDRASSEGAPHSDPYNHATATHPGSTTTQKRRSLDDMRRLSEEIKAAKSSGSNS